MNNELLIMNNDNYSLFIINYNIGGIYMYKKVELPKGFPGMEREVLNFWKEKDIIDKKFKLNENG